MKYKRKIYKLKGIGVITAFGYVMLYTFACLVFMLYKVSIIHI